MTKLMRPLLFSVLLFFLGGVASAQPEVDEERMEKNYQEKLEKDFLKKVDWEQSFKDALARSKETQLPVLAYFTRSYAP